MLLVDLLLQGTATFLVLVSYLDLLYFLFQLSLECPSGRTHPSTQCLSGLTARNISLGTFVQPQTISDPLQKTSASFGNKVCVICHDRHHVKIRHYFSRV